MVVPVWFFGTLCVVALGLLVVVVVLMFALLRARQLPDLQGFQQQLADLNRRVEEWQRTGATEQQVKTVQDRLTEASQSIVSLQTVLNSLSNFTQQTLHREASERLQQSLQQLSQLQEALKGLRALTQSEGQRDERRHSELQRILQTANSTLEVLHELLQGLSTDLRSGHQQINDRLVQASNILAVISQALGNVQQHVQLVPDIQRLLNEVADQVGDLTAVLSGRASGRAAERWVEDLLSIFPEGWIQQDVPIGQGKVEFAVCLPGGSLVPLDSKFVEPDLLSELQEAYENGDENRISEAERKVNGRVRERAGELTRYLNDSRTLGFGIAAIPDPAYRVCRKAIKDAASRRVVLVPYSLLVPFVMSLYFLAQRLGITALTDVDRRLGVISSLAQEAQRELENMAREITTVSNQRERALDKIQQISRHLQQLTGQEIALPPSDGEGEQPTLPA